MDKEFPWDFITVIWKTKEITSQLHLTQKYDSILANRIFVKVQL